MARAAREVAADESPRRRETGSEPDAGDGSPAGGDVRRDQVLVAVALVPLVVSAITLALHGENFFPTGDLATSELAVRDIGSHPVLYGLWSRADWSHPGPMLWYLLWPLFRLTGSTGVGLALGALVINGVAMAGIASLARRRGGTPLMVLSLLGCALLVRTLGGGFTASYWNLHITTLPFALLLFLVWSLACGDRWALPATAVVATFLAQTHVGFVPVGVALAAWGVGHMVLAAARGPEPAGTALRRAARPATATAGLLAILWLPPVIDLATNSPSNARRISSWFASGEDGTHSLGEGWRVVTGQFGLRPEWLTGKLPPSAPFAESPFRYSSPVPLLLIVVAGAGWVLWRRSPDVGRRLATTLAVALVVSMFAVARTVGPLSDYRLRWTWVVPMACTVAVAWAGWLSAEHRRPADARRWLLPAAVGALLVVTAVDGAASARARTLEEQDAAMMAELAPPVLDELERLGVSGDDEVLVSDPHTAASWFANGLVLQLERHGYDARVAPERGWQFGDHRVTTGHADLQLRVVRDAVALDLLEAPNARLLSMWSTVPMDDDGVATLRSTFAAINEAYSAWAAGELDRHELGVRLAEIDRPAPAEGDMAMRVAAVYLIDDRTDHG